jgi:LPXTG-motif cell wall-anchored protein
MATTSVRALAIGASITLVCLSVTALPAAAEDTAGSAFSRISTYPVYLNLPTDADPSAETVAEISTVTADGNTLISTDAAGQRIGFLDISDPSAPIGKGSVSLAELGHADDQPTSVAAFGDYVLVVIDETGGDFPNPKGRVDVLRLSDRERVASIDLLGQPDSIAISKDGAYAAIAMENQRDEEFTPEGGEEGDLPQAPAGFVQVIELAGTPSEWTADPIALPASALAGLDTPEDAEPEYVSINDHNQLALSLQENNGVVIIDLVSRSIENVFSAGTVDLTQIDTEDDGLIRLDDTLTAVPREPDSIAWIGTDYIATANEGDWKGGSRGWTVFDTAGNVVWDAGNSYEHLAVQHGLYNDGRADNKGAEPEGLAVAEFGGTTYAFVASERSNFVAVYSLTDPTSPRFEQLLFATNGPEGILPIPARNLLAVSSETDDAAARVRAAVNLYQFGPAQPNQPSIISAEVDGLPIGWSALGALTADPVDAGTLYSATDAALAESQLYTIDVTAEPAVITDVLPVIRDGAPATYDIEGLFARPQGGFWLASEGATGPENLMVRIDDAGVVQEEIALPEDVSSHIRNWGLEGITASTNDAGNEVLYIAVQRPLWVDPSLKPAELVPFEGENTTRIGRYDLTRGEWAWFGYELDSTSTAGDWLGLSEITLVDENTLAVIERDKLNGPDAAVKRIMTIEIPSESEIAAAGGAVIPVQKTLALDVLPVLQSFRGWTQEKLEGFTIAADGRLYGVTDNDGLDDATGETQFLRLGSAAEVFGTDPAPTASPEPTNSPEPTSSPAPTSSSVPTASVTPSAVAIGTLPHTGTDQSLLLLGLGGGVALLAAGAVFVSRRRSS